MLPKLVFFCFAAIYIGSGNGSRCKIVDVLRVKNGSPWGDWLKPVFCTPGYFAAGVKLRIEKKQGRGDDTGLNGITLICKKGCRRPRIQLKYNGFWGEWNRPSMCPRDLYLTSFQLQNEGALGSKGDDTTANYVRFLCGHHRRLNSGHGHFGTFGSWSNKCPRNSAICGMSIKLEGKQGAGDDTALNDVEFYCCKTYLPKIRFTLQNH